MTLSVCVITYNHERFITQTIESILNQKTSFDFEIVIGDDSSTDLTRNILKQYKKKYPKKIKLILRNKRLGISRNFKQTLESCTGEYIAIVEGDDYWISKNKLQKQVSFLKNNSDYVICGHRVKIIYDLPNKKTSQSALLNKDTFLFRDLAKENMLYTGSCVFRNGLIKKYPTWLLDWPLFLLVSQFGKIKVMPNIMGVYRMHAGGAWSTKSKIKKNQHSLLLAERCNRLFKNKYTELFGYRLAPLYLEMYTDALVKGHFGSAIKYATKAASAYRFRGPFGFFIFLRRAIINLFKIVVIR